MLMMVVVMMMMMMIVMMMIVMMMMMMMMIMMIIVMMMKEPKQIGSSRLGVRLWNALPENISKLKAKNLFKRRLHELLINILKTENSYPSTASIINKIKNI